MTSGQSSHTLSSATERSSYSVWAHDRLRFSDTDLQGHINNAVFATFCETGRVSFLFDEELNLRGPGASFVIARLEVDYRAELFYPGEVDIGTRVLHIGRTSFRVGQGIFNGDTCAATAESVLVLMDDTTRKPKPLTTQLRAWLEGRLAR